jgi:Uma2 family endonuclease
MGLPLAEKKYYTLEEYLVLEEQSEIRHEFYQGEIFAMAGTSIQHNLIVDNIKDEIKKKFQSQGCMVLTENVKLEVIKNMYYPYPDVILTCHTLDKKSEFIIKYPSLLVEVLSKSTSDYDRGLKWLKYKKMPSLKHYLLVSQYEILVELYSRNDNSDIWTYQVFDNQTDEIYFNHLDFKIPVQNIYQNIEFVDENENFENQEVSN